MHPLDLPMAVLRNLDGVALLVGHDRLQKIWVLDVSSDLRNDPAPDRSNERQDARLGSQTGTWART